jgi:glycosyltransferase involved in cell wall biosynthesis
MHRVLRIINRLNLGGPTYNAALLTKHLAPDFETLLVSGAKQDSEESSDFIVTDMGLTYRQLPEMRRELNFFSDRRAYLEIRRIIREFKPHIVHTHAAKPGTLGRLAAIHEKVPAVVHTFHGHVFHSYFGAMKTRVFLEIERYLAARSSAIVAISEKQKQELVETYRLCNSEKTHVIPLGFDLSRFREDREAKRKAFREKYKISGDEVAVGIIGRLVPVKDHAFFFRSIKEILKDQNRRIKVLVIGDGEEREKLFALAKSLGLDAGYYPSTGADSKFLFTSWIHEVDVAVAGLDIVALTSLNEGTPVSLIEAQAGSKAVVSTRVGGVEDVVDEKITGLLSEPHDLKGFTANLAKLIDDESFRNALGAKGWPHVMEKYHYTRLMDDMRQLYRTLLQ